ncbi:MAG: HD domain-containing phosphohydrolase, partial [Pseudomonadota bacterium]
MNIISWDEFRRQQQGEYQLTITPGELRLGDFVSRVEGLEESTTFPPRGMRIDSFQDKKWFKENCRRVVIDLERCLNRRADDSDASLSSAGSLPPLPNTLDALRKRTISARGMVEAWQVYRRLSLVTQAQILSFHRHGHIDVADANDAVEELINAIPDHLPELLWLARIKETSRYPFQHGLNTAIFAAAFAHAAGWPGKVRTAVTMSALVHDLGMMRVSLQVLRKNGPLSHAEREHVRLHTRLGHELLAQNDGLPDTVARVALCHHERPDGRGYPDGLTLKGIPAIARLISIISAYDAMMTTRFHRPAVSHQQAMGELWKLRGQQFDEHLADAFSKFLGWAPPGTLMRLADGRMAISLHTRERENRPVVRVLHKRGGELEFGVELDLSENPSVASVEGKRETLLPDGSAGIKHRDLTKKLPKALVAGHKGGTDESSPAQARRERRTRPRVDAPRGTRILVIDDAL